MPAALPTLPPLSPQWPCGPDCAHAGTMPGSFGEWHWCHHPEAGGSLVPDGRECARYQSAPRLPDPQRPAPWLG